MNTPDGDRHNDTTRQAARDLASLKQQADATRGELASLRQKVYEASQQLTGSRAAQLLEANEQLIFASLRAKQAAEAVAAAVRTVPRPAELDPLTGLPNSVLMLDRIANAARDANGHQSRMALLVLNLSRFSLINETLGYSVGDQVLQQVAARLASAVEPAGTVSRHGGDTFLILLPDIPDSDEAMRVADALIATVGVPSSINGHMLNLKAKLGISIYPDDGTDTSALIEKADAAMHRARRHASSNVALHGQQLKGETEQAVNVMPSERTLIRQDLHDADHGRQQIQLQEANQQLVLAALDAQQLQRAAQQAQQRQTELLAMVAHELRNPLAPIRTAAVLLGHLHSDEPLLNRVQSILERQVAHMARLVNDLMDLSRVNTGKLRLIRQTVNLAQVIDISVETCQPLIDLRVQHLTLHTQTAEVLEVDGDPVRLAQVLTNLLDNASKYTPEGGQINLDVSATKDTIQLILTDSGIGIAADALSIIFDPFVQDMHAVDFSHLGLGIGLTVVRELVEAHGGTVSASSQGKGCGSQFTMTLPRIQAGD